MEGSGVMSVGRLSLFIKKTVGDISIEISISGIEPQYDIERVIQLIEAAENKKLTN
jgi:hypothetical protein